jgi:hypothetical protein
MAISSEQVCRCWINFNGTGTISTRDSYNVSSISDNGCGDYQISFSNNMSNTNYCAQCTVTYEISGTRRHRMVSIYTYSLGSCRVVSGHSDTHCADHEAVNFSVYGAQ